MKYLAVSITGRHRNSRSGYGFDQHMPTIGNPTPPKLPFSPSTPRAQKRRPSEQQPACQRLQSRPPQDRDTAALVKHLDCADISAPERMSELGAASMRALYDEHGAALCRHAVRPTGDRARAEDVAQETLLRASRHPEVFEVGERSVRAAALDRL
ncbi:MAG: polymerase sigma-70 factor, subfamily [Mycobacterium sp.]|jgi:hypothetical protein|nr:polymerase sigma-70 factor, subfamily [Mycobacterium sp.]